MQTTLETISVELEDIGRIVEDVFLTMTNRKVAFSSESAQPGHGGVTAAIHFAGTWKGAVLLQCNLQQALVFTNRLVPVLQPTTFDADVRDALGELVNMIGGNLKSVLHPGVALSMPSVVEGADYALHLCCEKPATTAVFASDTGPFTVTLVQTLDTRPPRRYGTQGTSSALPTSLTPG